MSKEVNTWISDLIYSDCGRKCCRMTLQMLNNTSCDIYDYLCSCVSLVKLYFLTNVSFGSFFPDIGFFQIPSHSSSKQIIYDAANLEIVQGHESAMSGMHSCYKCGKMYSWKANLLRHLRLECGKRPQLQCPHCPYITKRKSSLNRHVGSRHVTWC